MTGDIRIDALLQEQLSLATGLPAGIPLTVSYRFMENLVAPEGLSPLSSTVYDFISQRGKPRTLSARMDSAASARTPCVL
ncbi:hypothetical protein NYA30BAC_01413 [Halomonas sp. NYA30]